MKSRHTRLGLILAILLLLVAVPAQADEDYDDDDRVPNYALGLGFGLVDPTGDVEPYYTAGLRIRLGDHDRDRRRASGGIRGYIEPEVGYWSDDRTSDLLLGVNLIGLVPFQRVDYHFGVGIGYHFFDVDDVLDTNTGQLIDESDERLGMNAQFGIDVRMTDNVSIFGTARFDLVEDSDDEVQDKIFLGLRFAF